MKRKLFLGLLAAAAVLFTACQKDQTLSEVTEDNTAIGFGTYVGRDAQTKASSTNITAMQDDDYPGFGVFAYYTGDTGYPDNNTTYAPVFMSNVNVKYDDIWSYSDVKFWPGSSSANQTSFFAYAPYEEDANSNSSGITHLTSTESEDPMLTFIDPASVSTQFDLLYATPQKNMWYTQSNGGNVNLQFNHALSRIGFKAKTNSEHYRIKISSISLKGYFVSTNDFNLNTGLWSTDASDYATEKHTYTVSIANTHLIDVGDDSNNWISNNSTATAPAVNLTDTDDYLMIIPSKFTSTSPLTISVNYKFQYEITDGVWSTIPAEDVTHNVDNVIIDFEQGKAYTIVLTLNDNTHAPQHPITFTAEVNNWKPWNESQNTEDFPITVE